MAKTVGNNSAPATVDILSVEDLRDMKTALFVEEPRVFAWEVAEELGFDESGLSRLWRRVGQGRGGRLPHGIGKRTFLDAVARIRARKQAAA